MQVYTCNGTTAQSWTVPGDGTLRALGKCLDVQAAGTANGTLVQIYDCNGTGAQVWQPQANGSLVNPASGKCLDDTGMSTTPGTQAQIWTCTGGDEPGMGAALTDVRQLVAACCRESTPTHAAISTVRQMLTGPVPQPRPCRAWLTPIQSANEAPSGRVTM